MQKLIPVCLLCLIFFGCHKSNTANIKDAACDIKQAYANNEKKVTITQGIWGTLSNISGNCMPTIPAYNSSCKHCPESRTVRIYQYTLFSQATPSTGSATFFTSFNTPLVAQVDADEEGFFQVQIPPGHYSIAIVIDGKLYANTLDDAGGLNPVTFSGGKQNFNVVMTYGAVF